MTPPNKQATPPPHKQWVTDCLVPLDVCETILAKANQYDNPQSAWEQWDVGWELLWLLVKTGYDDKKLTLCLCDIAEPVLEICQRRNIDTLLGNVIQVARDTIDHEWAARRDAVCDAARPIKAVEGNAVVAGPKSAAHHAAYAIARVVAKDGRHVHLVPNEVYWVGSWVASCTMSETGEVFFKTHYDQSNAENRRQCDLIRKYFPWEWVKAKLPVTANL